VTYDEMKHSKYCSSSRKHTITGQVHFLMSFVFLRRTVAEITESFSCHVYEPIEPLRAESNGSYKT
jgi:hypothetical protein